MNKLEMHLNFYVMWSPEDGQYIGRCTQYPSLSWLEDDRVEALAGILKLVLGVLEDEG